MHAAPAPARERSPTLGSIAHRLLDADTRRLLIAGDTHASLPSVRALIDVAVAEGVEVIVQLGDFGYWPHTAAGRAFLDGTAPELDAAGRVLVFVDGNHENHELLRRNLPDETGFVPLHDTLYWAPRGQRWRWQDVTFVALGGAVSLDRKMRTPGVSWWPEESLTPGDAAAAAGGGRANVVLCHDAPLGVLDTSSLATRTKLSTSGLKLLRRLVTEDEIAAVRRNRRMLADAVETIRPAWIFHAHYHHRHHSVLRLEGGQTTEVVGLDRDGTGTRQWAIVETAELKVPAGSSRAGVRTGLRARR